MTAGVEIGGGVGSSSGGAGSRGGRGKWKRRRGGLEGGEVGAPTKHLAAWRGG